MVLGTLFARAGNSSPWSNAVQAFAWPCKNQIPAVVTRLLVVHLP
jgi:hypothetical protein